MTIRQARFMETGDSAQLPHRIGGRSIDALPRGRILVRSFLRDQAVDYFLRLPGSRAPRPGLLVAMHGIGRNPLQHMIHLSALAETLGAVLVAPYFPEKEYPRFQRFRTSEGRLRPDIRLDRIVADARLQAGIDEAKIDLFGFSAGAQFAHRYAMAYPAKIDHLICASAGWYTLPDFDLDFPLGLRQPETRKFWNFDLQAFSKVPTLVAVGERDIRRGASLNVKPKIDSAQGMTRYERALAWVEAMNKVARQWGCPPNVTFKSLDRSGHSLRRCVVEGGLCEAITDFFGCDSSRPVP